MFRIITTTLLLITIGAGTQAQAKKTKNLVDSDKWQYAGESHGVKFSLIVTNECSPKGATVAVKLENNLDQAVSVSFRLNDPDWSKTLEKDLAPGAKDTSLKFNPESGTACHLYVDEIYVDSKEAQTTSMSGEGENP